MALLIPVVIISLCAMFGAMGELEAKKKLKDELRDKDKEL